MIAIRSILWRLGLTLGALVLLASCGIEQSISSSAPPTQAASAGSPPPAPGASPVAQPIPAATPSPLPSVTPHSQAPTLTPTPSNLQAPARLTVTLADDGKTIALGVGQRFLLSLGSDFNWTVTIDDPNIVTRVANITVPKGAEGVYEAKKAGTTTLHATGVVICPPGQMCMQIALALHIQIVVK